MFDRFDDHDRVVDHDPDGKDDPEQREVVDRESETFHRRECSNQRNGDRDQRDDRGAPGLEKDQDHENDKRYCFEKRLLHFVDRFADRNRRVVNNRVVEPGRETLLELSHFLSHGVGRGERV